MNRFGFALMLCLALEPPGMALAQGVETELPGVTAELLDLRQSGGVLRLAVRLTNAAADDHDRARFPIDRIVLVDAASKTKHLPLKAADKLSIGGPFDHALDGGRIRVHLPGKQSTTLVGLLRPRANAVTSWLVSHGVAGARVSATGAGESRPATAGTTDADHQANRRVEIRIGG